MADLMKTIGTSIRGTGAGCSGAVTGGSTDAAFDQAGAGSAMCTAADLEAFEAVCKWEVKTDEQALRLVGLRTRPFRIHHQKTSKKCIALYHQPYHATKHNSQHC